VQFLEISYLSIRNGAHKLWRRFLDFSHFFYRNYVKIVAPSSDENENFVAHLKELSILKKSKTASKSTHKPRLNACSNYAPLERTVLRTRSVTKKNTFSHLQPARAVRSSPNFAWS